MGVGHVRNTSCGTHRTGGRRLQGESLRWYQRCHRLTDERRGWLSQRKRPRITLGLVSATCGPSCGHIWPARTRWEQAWACSTRRRPFLGQIRSLTIFILRAGEILLGHQLGKPTCISTQHRTTAKRSGGQRKGPKTERKCAAKASGKPYQLPGLGCPTRWLTQLPSSA